MIPCILSYDFYEQYLSEYNKTNSVKVHIQESFRSHGNSNHYMLHYLQLLIHCSILKTDNGLVTHLHSLFVAPRVTIVSSPDGIAVSGSTNTFDYPILSNVTLTCMVDPVPIISVMYSWDTTSCYTNAGYSGRCFPDGQVTQSVTGSDVTAEDAGTITCTVTINDREYTSDPFTVRISGEQLVYTYMPISLLLCML